MDISFSITGSDRSALHKSQKAGLAIAALITLYLCMQFYLNHGIWGFVSIFSGYLIATLLYIKGSYAQKSAGIKNDQNFFRSLTFRGAWGWAAGIFLTGFYVLLYWYPQYLGFAPEGTNTGIVGLFDPLSYALKGQAASQWFMYGAFYTMAILYMGVKFLLKYRHNRYQQIRTLSVMFFQLGFAFLLPEILMRLNQPYFDFKNIWPLNYYAFFGWKIDELIQSGELGIFMLIWSVVLILVVTPVLTYFFGKRWYCSWVCGCGGLAETAGDPFRHLSDKSVRAWQIERWLIHLVLVFVVVMTVAVLYNYVGTEDPFFNRTNLAVFWTLLLGGILAWVFLDNHRFQSLDPIAKWGAVVIVTAVLMVLWEAVLSGRSELFGIPAYQLSSSYGFLIGAAFSGVIGVGFYPILGNRVWCRFGCPMAAILGLQQKFFSKFRITTNGSQCISCGNCSTYCEMGIDVKWYAQRGQNIVRASCVGCGICSAVCPRGVLRLENGPDTSQKDTELKVLQIQTNGVEFKP
jgi:polyferredoxin